MAAFLLDRGADVNAACHGTTPRRCTRPWSKNDLLVAQLLLERGAAVNAKTKSGWTPCHFAASDGNVELMRLLVEHGGDWRA